MDAIADCPELKSWHGGSSQLMPLNNCTNCIETTPAHLAVNSKVETCIILVARPNDLKHGQEVAGNDLNPTAVAAVTTEAGPGMEESAVLS